MTAKYLKNHNTPILVVYLAWNVAVYLVASNGASSFWTTIHQRVRELGTQDSLFCFLTPLVLTTACGLLPASFKASLVFWRVKDPLPGCRAFTKLMKTDQRIDESVIRNKLGEMPESPRDENTVWYRWYKVVQDHTTVKESHKQFLLCRDLTGISFLFLVFGTLALFPSSASAANIGKYAALTLLQYLVFSVVARNHGNRFVCNVLVEYQHRT